MKKVYIYGLHSSDDITIRYIGKTINLYSRLRMHISQRKNKNSYKNNWINKVIESGSNIEMMIIEVTDEYIWPKREKYWISKYREQLTNISEGGTGGNEIYNINYNDCQIIVSKMNIKSREQWFRNIKNTNFPKNIPKSPREYFGKEWISWGHFLSSNKICDNKIIEQYLDYDSAKKWILNNIGIIKSRGEWKSITRNKIIPIFIPNRPERFYKKRGWISWGDFLSNGRVANQLKEILSYESAKLLVNNLNIKTLKVYKIIQKDYVNILPAHPHLTYKNKGYITYDEFFRY